MEGNQSSRVERSGGARPGGGRVQRVEVWPAGAEADARARALVHDARAVGVAVGGARTAKVYLLEATLSPDQLRTVMERLLADPVTERAGAGARPAAPGAATVEVHPLPGVMDPVAQSVREAIRELVGLEVGVSTGRRFDLGGVDGRAARRVASRLLANPVIHRIHEGPYWPTELAKGYGYRFELTRVPIRALSDEQLARLSREAHLFLSLDEMRAIQAEFRRLEREPTDAELETLAQTWSEHCVHKTLKSRIVYRGSGVEVSGCRGVEGQAHGGALLTPGHLDTSTPSARPGHTVNPDGSITIDNLLKSTVAAATHELIAEGVDWTLSVFKDNAGVIAFDDRHAVCVKVETHNHPSAIEPYGGAATGAGGCIRDVIGTGLGAKPIACTDVFCVANPERWVERPEHAEGTGRTARPSAEVAGAPLPPGVLHPRRVLTDVVSGVRDYGNRMGIPTLSGGVFFDDRYVGNPLVFCGCVGVMRRDMIRGAARPGDRIIAIGGRTGRDGIHGATFSSAELTATHADEFSHAVQIGNAIEEKRVLDAVMRARDGETERRRDEETGNARQPGSAGSASLDLSVSSSLCLFHAITDCGAGGFSSAVGEMGRELGAEVHLERAPLKYDGLSYTEIWISEAQERMVLAVPPENVPALRRICGEEGVELADLGHFGTPGAELVLHYHGNEVGRLPMEFLHEGLPQPVREAAWESAKRKAQSAEPSSRGPDGSGGSAEPAGAIGTMLRRLLSHPTIASKHWIVRQYDHEVQGNTVLKPLVGPGGRGPGDASVIEPVPGTGRGLAIACGLQTPVGDPAIGGDPYQMALAAIDECVRNLVCVGADPARIAILDNFCWPSCARPENLGALVRAAWGCYDGAKAYRTPFVSGKDSLNNQFAWTDPDTGRQRLIEIPPTLLITGIGIVPDIARCVTMEAKRAGNLLVLVGRTTGGLGGSVAGEIANGKSRIADEDMPRVDLGVGPATARGVAGVIERGLVASAHDCSEGGVLVAVAEMLIGAANGAEGLGAELSIDPGALGVALDAAAFAFAENPSRYVLEMAPEDLDALRAAIGRAGPIEVTVLGRVTDDGRLRWGAGAVDEPVARLAEAWLGTLDW